MKTNASSVAPPRCRSLNHAEAIDILARNRKGALEILSEGATFRHADVEQQTRILLQRVVPETFTDDDPAELRAALFRMHLSDLTACGARTTLRE